jgi:predicted dinucleotide-binding enzyme
MEIGILGTGGVAQTLARRWSEAGHQITFGSREVPNGFLARP